MNQNIRNSFSILELTPSASFEEVKRSYRRLAKKYHPDSSSTSASEAQFARLASAYELLSNYFENPQAYSAPTDVTKGKRHNSRHSRSQEEKEERIRQAKERANKQRQAEIDVIQRVYEKTRRPILKGIHLSITCICLLFNSVIITDYFSPEVNRTVQMQNISNLYQSSRYEQVTVVTTYGNELFYVDGSLLFNVLSGADYAHEGIVAQSRLLQIPRHLKVNISEDRWSSFDIDESAYWMFPVFSLLLISGVLFYLIQKKKMFSYIILFYSSLGLSVLGLLIITLNGVLERIFQFVF